LVLALALALTGVPAGVLAGVLGRLLTLAADVLAGLESAALIWTDALHEVSLARRRSCVTGVLLLGRRDRPLALQDLSSALCRTVVDTVAGRRGEGLGLLRGENAACVGVRALGVRGRCRLHSLGLGGLGSSLGLGLGRRLGCSLNFAHLFDPVPIADGLTVGVACRDLES